MSKRKRENDMKILQEVVKVLIIEALNDQPDEMDLEELHDHVYHNFKSLKEDIQVAIGQAFSDAVQEGTGEYADYYCDIKPIPEPLNKLEC